MTVLQRSLALGAFAAGALAGCSSDDGAPPAAVTGASAMAVRDDRVTCTPNVVRACRVEWVDALGQQHCPAGEQTCSDAGDAWSTCGAPSAPSEGAAATEE